MSDALEASRVLVVGDGVAGVAAAFAAALRGASVLVISRGNGASSLTSGAVDWAGVSHDHVDVARSAKLRAFVDALGLWRIGEAPVRLASPWGVLRGARGCDRALLDLAPIAGGRIGVPSCPRACWDAPLLAKSWSDDPWAHRTGTRFEAFDAKLLVTDEESFLSDVDFAGRMDDPLRLDALCRALAEASSVFDALLLGPWLGLDSDVAGAASRWLGKPVGETLTHLGGAAGVRFERAAQRLTKATTIQVLRSTVSSLSASVRGIQVHHSLEPSPVSAAAVVVACGALVGGGLRFRSPETDDARELPVEPAPVLRLSFEAPLVLMLGTRPVVTVASMHGANLERFDWPAALDQPWSLDRAYVRHRELQALDETGGEIPGLFVAGEVATDAAGTIMNAIDTGLRAGGAAASHALS